MGLLSSNEKKRAAAAELQQKRESASVFPSYDRNGNEFFRTYEFTLTGTRHKHDGNYGEKYIKESIIGDDVQLVWDKDNPYDREGWAVKVLWNGHYLGWLPADSGMMRQPIVLRLERGETVLARIKDIRDVKIREKSGEVDEDGEDIWEDVLARTAVVVVGVYDLPRKKTGKKESAPPEFTKEPPKVIISASNDAPPSEPVKPRSHDQKERQARLCYPAGIVLIVLSVLLTLAFPLPGCLLALLGIYGTTLRRTVVEQKQVKAATPLYKRKAVVIGAILVIAWTAICLSI